MCQTMYTFQMHVLLYRDFVNTLPLGASVLYGNDETLLAKNLLRFSVENFIFHLPKIAHIQKEKMTILTFSLKFG